MYSYLSASTIHAMHKAHLDIGIGFLALHVRRDGYFFNRIDIERTVFRTCTEQKYRIPNGCVSSA